MAMNKVPTLVVGIGGIGCQIAAGVGELLGREDREYVGIVGIDTNVNDISTLQGNSGIRMITTSDSNTVRDHLKAHREYTRWFPVSKFIVDKTTTDGAGQIRAVSRLTAIAAEMNGRFTPIEEEIKRVRRNKGENKRNTLAVMIVGSITGGTGAGLFLQIPYYIRSYVKRTTGLDGLVIRGMFVSADITGPVQPSRINEDAVHANAYACIKELNAFYLTQTDPRQQKLLDLEWFEKQDEEERRITARRLKDNYDPDDDLYEDDEDALILADDGVSAEDRKILSDDQANIPYNYLYLIENDDQGLVSIESVVNQISRIVFTYLFTPVSNNALSIEDNFALQDTGRNGMNRYASAGLCRLIYPKELVETYVTLCSARDLVKEQWLKIDQDCEEERKVRINDMKTDPRAEIPKVEDSYRKFFEHEVKQGALTRLAKQAYSDEDMKVSNANDFLDTVDGIIKETLSQEELVNAKNACTLDMSKMKKAGSAKKQITELYEAFEEYEKLAKVMVETAPAGIANAIFPTSFESLINSKEKPGSIYSLLFNAHPIVARNYCYQLITELNTRIEALEDKVKGVNLDAYEDADFDDTEDDVQSPQQAIDKITKSKGILGIKGIARKLGADVDADQLEKLTQDVNQKLVNYQMRQIANYLETLKLKVYTYLRKRLLLLTKNYERFFEGLSEMIKSNEKSIEEIEKDTHLPLGEKGVCCNAEALRAIYEDYKDLGRFELPDETCKEIFEQIFRVFADDYDAAGKNISERRREKLAEARDETLANIFETAVITTLRQDLKENGRGITDMTIVQALKKQMELEKNVTKTNKDYDEMAAEYIRQEIRTALNMAAPMLSASHADPSERTSTAYLTLNPRCAVRRNNEPSIGASEEAYVPMAIEGAIPVKVLMDEEFSPYEFTCLRAEYKFLAEELVKYRPGSENAQAYEERIRNLGREPVDISDPDAYKTVINPHLNRYWHEEGYLPDIDPFRRGLSREDCVKAFIYGLGYDLFYRTEDESQLDKNGNPRRVWSTILWRSGKPVTVRGKAIGNEFANLYFSIPFNGRLKRAVLNFAKRETVSTKGHYQSAELFENILNDAFIADLCQVSPDEVKAKLKNKENATNKDDAEMNIFDVFLAMIDQLSEKEWTALFDILLDTLWEYCASLFDSNEGMVNNATKKILKTMYENCTAVKRPGSVRKAATDRLNAQYEHMLAQNYVR